MKPFRIISAAISLSLLSINTWAQEVCLSSPFDWYLLGTLGYGEYQYQFQNDGQTPLLRLGIGKKILCLYQTKIGIELSVQTGNTMRLDGSQTSLNVLGGLPIQTTMKPMIDFLLAARSRSWNCSAAFVDFKGGFAYQRWQIDDRTSVNDVSELVLEIQLGVGYQISEKTALSLLYQSIFGGNPDFTVNTVAQTGHIQRTPFWQAILLTLSMDI